MKFLKYLLIILILVGGVGYGVFYLGTNIVSDKVMDAVYVELENSGQLDEIKQMVNSNPEIKQFVEDGENVDESKLPFKTKEQATRAIIQKVGIGELKDLQSKYQNGMSNTEMKEVLSGIEGKLTEQEILALKVLAYKELNK